MTRERLLPWLAALSLAAGVFAARTEDAAGGEIRGRVRLQAASGDRPQLDPYPGRVKPRDVAARTAGAGGAAYEDVVIYVQHVDPPFHVAPPERPAMVQRNVRFVPRVLPVLQNQAVDFPNEDGIYHNVFSYTPCCRFDLGRYPRGEGRQVSFKETGLVRVFCEIHSDMAAYIVVLQNPHFTKPDAAGEFRLPDVPAGPRRLVAWHPALGETEVEVTVPAEGTTRLEIAL